MDQLDEHPVEPDEVCETRPCERPVAFWAYNGETERWRPSCEHHLRAQHPSLEVAAWLESGYAKPAALPRPAEPPAAEAPARAAAFREIVEAAMGWAGVESEE